MNPICAVGGVVYRLNDRHQLEVLLIRKRGSTWSLPKGKLKTDEPHDAALSREIHEETGVIGVPEEFVGEAVYTIKKQGPRTKIVTYYLVRAVGGNLRPDRHEKIKDVVWVSLPRALRRVRRPRLQAILRAAQSILVVPVLP